MKYLLIILFIFAVSDTTKVKQQDTIRHVQQVDSLSIKLDSLIKILELKNKEDENRIF